MEKRLRRHSPLEPAEAPKRRARLGVDGVEQAVVNAAVAAVVVVVVVVEPAGRHIV